MRVVVDAAGDQATVASRVRGKRPVDLEGRTGAGGEQERVALAPLVQAIELPHPEPDADGRDQERDHQADPIAPVYPHFGLIARSARARASRRVTAAAAPPTDPVGARETPTVRGDARGCTRSPSPRGAASGALEGRW